MALPPEEQTYVETPFIERPIAIGWARRDPFNRRNRRGRGRGGDGEDVDLDIFRV